MFAATRFFNSDISKWDVSSVAKMDSMFMLAESFKHILCGAAWVRLTASTTGIFEGSHGAISSVVCKPGSRPYVSRRPIPGRELIGRTLIVTPAVAPTIIRTMATCLKCATFAKSGRVSCCAPGGAWYKNCGGAGNRNADHSWFEGTQACRRKLKGNGMHMHN